MALEPITRQEQIIAGKDLEPITRMEKFLKQYGGGGNGSGGGSFVLRPTAEEVTFDKTNITCTANYDELAKALEDNKQVYLVFPPSTLESSFPFDIKVSPTVWLYIPNRGLCCVFGAFDKEYQMLFVNGTYVPKL